ncbi:hypothetical protein GCM10011403_26210 [Pseudohongiella nitratireducens]|uniref:Core-binding (CB) domain-containing protein n=1 Tax=Pseudohongiella nitratireducens TaxID=1768907 RepID=A0A916QNA8_9GAMM|nr:site-specific integrase [Pseudohongiella nitratireducens]GFZ81616.1 hypothetical protein GCM10011403_26210 [Pseudohongiella nitratireducens]
MSKSPFLQSISDHMRTRGYSKRTIETYTYWIKHFILFCDKQHPDRLSETDVERFLTYLAVRRHVSPGTQDHVWEIRQASFGDTGYTSRKAG